MALARVRIATRPPLPPWKAWMPFEPSATVQTFKLAVLAAAALIDIPASGVEFQLEGFTILDASSCAVFDQKNDVLELVLRNGVAAPSADGVQLPNGRANASAAIATKRAAPSSSGSDPSSSESDSSSDSDSESSSSSSDGSPEAQPAKAAVPKPATAEPVVPGHGLRRTKARNARKRKKRKFEKEAPGSNGDLNATKAGASALAEVKQAALAAIKQGEESHGPIRQTQGGNRTNGATPATAAMLASSSNSSSSSGSSSSSSSKSSESSSSGCEGQPALSTSATLSGLRNPSEAPVVQPTNGASAPLIGPIRPTLTTQPVSAQASTKQDHLVTQDNFTMFSLRNPNKRKNFRSKTSSASYLPVTARIRFTDDVVPPPPSAPFPPSPSYTPQSPKFVPTNVPASIPLPCSPPLRRTEPAPPPSMRRAECIPHNIFITGVDVEADDWVPGAVGWDGVKWNMGPIRRSNKRKKKKKTAKDKTPAISINPYTSTEYVQAPWAPNGSTHKAIASDPCDSGTESHNEDEEAYDDNADDAIDDAVMQDIEDAYAEFVSGTRGALSQEGEPCQSDYVWEGWEDWPSLAAVDTDWPSLLASTPRSVKPEQRLALRVLEVNCQTFTPEVQTFYGAVVKCDASSILLQVHPSCWPQSNEPYEPEDADSGEGDRGGAPTSKREIKAGAKFAYEEDAWWDGEIGQTLDGTNAYQQIIPQGMAFPS